MEHGQPSLDLARAWHDYLPDRIRAYLNRRGISDRVIDGQLVGWNGRAITIPIFDRNGRLAHFKLAKDPRDRLPGPKMLIWPSGSRVELYGWERVIPGRHWLVVCEGEFDRLLLESRGIPAVTSTGGAGCFREEWAEALRGVTDLCVCFDRDGVGEQGARRLCALLPGAKIVELPEEVGPGGDVTDFFVRLGKSRDDFERLLREAAPCPVVEDQPPPARPRCCPRSPGGEAAAVKSAVALESVVSQYVPLHGNETRCRGLCPFHDDHNPSLVVYSDTGTFHCYGCGAHGDVFEFLMKMENLSFSEALEAVRRLAPKP